MTKPNSHAGTEFDPKHRVVGAVILALFAIVFLPMILGHNPPGPGNGVTPSGFGGDESKVFVSKITPAQGQETLSLVQPPTPIVKSTEIIRPKTAVVARPAKPSKPIANKPSMTVSDSVGWLVRIGTFSQKDNAKRIVSALKSKGFAPKTGTIKSAKGPATRVWVGPFKKRDEAVSVRRQILKDTGQEGLIVATP
ncbi:MAG TPA: SPOR domain-containing protein [Acidiferrobacteraceae bacterium]|nr:SPOR domain-containing protein [Acidiferrobacteraceae bacterium]